MIVGFTVDGIRYQCDEACCAYVNSSQLTSEFELENCMQCLCLSCLGGDVDESES